MLIKSPVPISVLSYYYYIINANNIKLGLFLFGISVFIVHAWNLIILLSLLNNTVFCLILHKETDCISLHEKIENPISRVKRPPLGIDSESGWL